MSVEIMSLVFDSYPTGGGERLLALALADCSSESGEQIFPSVAYLTRATMQSERSVRYQIKAMTDASQSEPWLLVVGKRKCRSGFVQVYRINPEWIAKAAVAKAQRLAERAAQFRAQTSVPDDVKPASDDGSRGAMVAPLDVEGVQSVQSRGAIDDSEGCNGCTQNHHRTISKEPKTRPTGDKPPVTSLPDPEDQRLAEFMLGLIRDRLPKFKEPHQADWCRDIRLMRERDDRTRHDIAGLFRWAQEHEFWRRNVLSPGKLRTQWDRLTAERLAEANRIATGIRFGASSAAPAQPADRRCVGAGDLAGRCGKPGASSLGLGQGARWYCRACNLERERVEANAEVA